MNKIFFEKIQNSFTSLFFEYMQLFKKSEGLIDNKEIQLQKFFNSTRIIFLNFQK